MLSKKPNKATKDLHKDILGTRNPGLGYMAKRAQPVLYDADTLLHPNHHPVSIWDSEEVLVHQVVSMKKMNEKPGHVRPKNGFYEKLNALMFVSSIKDLIRRSAYWLLPTKFASQASKSPHLKKISALLSLLSDIVVPPIRTAFAKIFKISCDKGNTLKVSVNCEAEISKQKHANFESEKSFCPPFPLDRIMVVVTNQALDTDRISVERYNTSLRIQLRGVLKGVKPTSETSKTVPKRPSNRSSLPDIECECKERIMESTDMPIELPPSASSSPKITMVSRFTDHKLSKSKGQDPKGISGSTDCSMGILILQDAQDHMKPIIGYGDYKLGDKLIISRDYYDEGLKHNLFSDLCASLPKDYDDVVNSSRKQNIGLAPQQMTSVPNSTELELTALQSGRSRSTNLQCKALEHRAGIEANDRKKFMSYEVVRCMDTCTCPDNILIIPLEMDFSKLIDEYGDVL
ncbi:hypothetical protein Tco_1448431 [Tanacetum coccineum]